MKQIEVSLQHGRLEIREELTFSSSLKAGNANVQRLVGKKVSLFSGGVFLFSSGLQLIGQGPPT